MKDKGYAKVVDVVNAKSKSGKNYVYCIIEAGGVYDVAYPTKNSAPLVAGSVCQYWTDKRDSSCVCKRCRGLE